MQALRGKEKDTPQIDNFPTSEISFEAIKEKKGRAGIFEMHFFWGRKPLIASRAAILQAILDNPDKKLFLELLGLNKVKPGDRAYNFYPDSTLLKKHTFIFDKRRPHLLDPFAGGGSIPFEALRMGFDVTAGDYNPIAWLILNTTLKYPSEHQHLLYDRITQVYSDLIDRMSVLTSHLYPEFGDFLISTYMYAWIASCPHCNFNTPLVNNWMLKKKPSKNGDKNRFDWKYMVPTIIDDGFQIEIVSENALKTPTRLQPGTVVRGKGWCLRCDGEISNSIIVDEIKQKKNEIPLVMVSIKRNKKGKDYHQFDKVNLDILRSAKRQITKLSLNYLPTALMPTKIVPARKYLETWDELLNSRQKIFFQNLIGACISLAKEKEKLWGDPWGKISSSYLALIIGKSIDFNSRCTSW
ncbi:MAG: DUF1156 domain-containing protein, partial [Candidatus Heimdallarchaeota archaeon]|nr:DUF1156 domain-containing protein [Candidatus Heimdallarchaeota archaeon]